MVSPIAIDLGGKNTGFFSFTNSLDNSQSGTIIYDESFVLSQVKRRGKRHGKRNNLRNKLVKRLFLLILQKYYGLSVDVLPDEIRGLFNKRGYTYASFEIKDDEREHLESDVLREFLNENLTYFNIKNDIEVEDFLNQIASDETTLASYKKEFESLFANSIHKPKKQFELVENISKELEKNDAKELLNGLKMVKKIVDEFDKQKNQGNLPRAKYFEELGEYIATNEKVKSFFDSNSLNLQDMAKLIGNLSNYQLKDLRRYFNDENMAKGDIWLPEKLHRITMRFARSWHPKDDETKVRRVRTIESLKTQNIIDFLTTTNPTETIPPYDDMNNRGAVKCQTLRLNEEYLDKHLPDWRKITAKLSHGDFGKDTVESTVKGWSEDSTLLHRLLDTSRDIDIYGLRGKNPSEMLARMLGQSDAYKLHNFASEYYELLRSKVRGGIWTSSDDMLKVCGKNPPHKGNQVHNLVAGILGVEISSDRFKAFEDELWNVKFGNRKLSSYCKNLEELRKSHGNLFKSYIEELRKKELAKLAKDEKSELTLTNNETLNEWSQKIANFFGIDDKHRQRFNNLFSMAQLHTIIDTPRSGFNSTCKWCSAENRFRSQSAKEVFDATTGEKITTEYYDEKNVIIRYENANCQRLPADTQRPFSGKIERYIDKLGFELAKIKAKELENCTAETIKIPIVLEQNAFEYEESIRSAKIKNANKKANDKLKQSVERYKKNLDSKVVRIKLFSNGTCPYCGEALGDDGEIDHILPRSLTLTRKYGGTVFNSEGNLIYVHQQCNQAKRESIYKAGDIKISIDSTWVEGQIGSIGKSYKTFSALNLDQQRAFRYALFLPNDNEAYQKVVGWLRTDQSSRVNGTQKYLAKKIQEKLTKMLPNKHLSFEFILADADDVSRLRKQFASQNPLLAKPDTQPPSSHTIDAAMAFLTQYPKVLGKADLPSADDVLSWIEINNLKTKPLSKIQKDQMGNLGGATIFKDSIYQERFAPVYEFDGNYFTGFAVAGNIPNFDNCASIKKQDFDSIKGYFKNETTKPNGLKVYEIDKQKTLTLFHNISRGECNELKLAELLNKFGYNLLKTSIAEAPKILKDDKKLSTKVYDKTLILPIRNEWLAFDKVFKKYLADKNIEYKEKDGNYNVDGDALDVFCKIYFKIEPKTIRNKARKQFSLPTVEAPSGGFRIKRTNHKNEPVFQLVGIDGAGSAGFAIQNGEVNTSTDVPLATLAKSKNVSFKNPQKMIISEYIDMNEFRKASVDELEFYVSMATVNRPKVIVNIDFVTFASMYTSIIDSIISLPSEIKIVENSEANCINYNNFIDMFGKYDIKPRVESKKGKPKTGKIQIIEAGPKNIKFIVELGSAYSKIKDYFKNAK